MKTLRICGCIVAVLAAPALAFAQHVTTSFGQLIDRLKVGESIIVITDAERAEGKVLETSSFTLVIAEVKARSTMSGKETEETSSRTFTLDEIRGVLRGSTKSRHHDILFRAPASLPVIDRDTHIWITGKDGSAVEGHVDSSTPSILSVQGKHAVSFNAADIARVELKEGNPAGTGAGIGLAAGFGMGALVCASFGAPGECYLFVGLVYGGLGAGIGAGVGAAFGHSDPAQRVIFSAPTVSKQLSVVPLAGPHTAGAAVTMRW